MKLVNSRIESLKEMLSLAEKRVNLQGELDAIEERISSLSNAISSGRSEVSAPAPSRSIARSSSVKTGKRNPRGLLKDKIMTALEAAGSEGVRVKDLAEALGQKPVNIHSWFHSNVKRNPVIQKLDGGHYRLSGKGGATPSPSSSKAAGKPGRKPKEASQTGGRRRGKRGALGARIVEALQAAGPGGISVTDLADKIGVKYKNIYVWFATTGKKNSAIKKVSPAVYSMAA